MEEKIQSREPSVESDKKEIKKETPEIRWWEDDWYLEWKRLAYRDYHGK